MEKEIIELNKQIMPFILDALNSRKLNHLESLQEYLIHLPQSKRKYLAAALNLHYDGAVPAIKLAVQAGDMDLVDLLYYYGAELKVKDFPCRKDAAHYTKNKDYKRHLQNLAQTERRDAWDHIEYVSSKGQYVFCPRTIANETPNEFARFNKPEFKEIIEKGLTEIPEPEEEEEDYE